MQSFRVPAVIICCGRTGIAAAATAAAAAEDGRWGINGMLTDKTKITIMALQRHSCDLVLNISKNKYYIVRD